MFSHDYVGGPQLGYVKTSALEEALEGTPYGSDVTLLAAMAVSGAAFASAMGKMSGPFNMLLSLTNARLGAWLPNPRYHARISDGDAPSLIKDRAPIPRVRRLTYLVKEIFGVYSPDDRLAYITDGGHYENLGLVELLRRRCATIYCVDAAGDTSLAHTLAEAASLAYEELGVVIDIDGVPLATKSAVDGTAFNVDMRALEKRLASEPVITGTITYPREAFGEDVKNWVLTGELIVGKAVLTADLPFSLQAHATRALKFPSETTADQWLDAAQFNAYLALGRRVAARMCDAAALRRSQLWLTYRSTRDTNGSPTPTRTGPNVANRSS